MHEIQAIAIDVPGICQWVCLVTQLLATSLCKHNWMDGGGDSWRPKEHCIRFRWLLLCPVVSISVLLFGVPCSYRTGTLHLLTGWCKMIGFVSISFVWVSAFSYIFHFRLHFCLYRSFSCCLVVSAVGCPWRPSLNWSIICGNRRWTKLVTWVCLLVWLWLWCKSWAFFYAEKMWCW